MGSKVATALIEKKAISVLKEVLLTTERIDPHISENDTQISWDGELYFYDSREKFGQKDCDGRIPVQVKGTTKQRTKNGMLEHSASLIDLKNYQQDGGCIYFVICQTPIKDIIYYELLLPFDLEKILSKKRNSNAKTTTLYLNPFPSEQGAIVALMRLFISERKKQVSTAEFTFDIKNPDEKAKSILLALFENDIAPLSFTLFGTTENPFESSFDIPTYFYANTPVGLQIPVQRIQMESITMGDLPCAVSVDGIKYYGRVRITKCKDKETVVIGKSTTIDLPNTMAKTDTTVNFSESGTLSERISDYEFWLAVCSNDKCRVTCEDVFDGDIRANRPENYLNNITSRLKQLKDIKNALDFFGVYDDLNLDALTEKDQIHLDILVHASRGEELSISIDGRAAISSMKIANLNISVFVEELENGKYKIYNFFNIPKLDDCTFRYNDEQCEASPYLIMRKKSLVESSNTNYDIMYDRITSIPFVPLYASMVTLFLLEVICAYDEKTNDNLLQFADKLSAWLMYMDCSEASQLNRLQVLKRQRKITKEDQKSLRKIVSDGESSISKIGACILLESFSEARLLWDELTEQEIKDVKRYSCFPILNLWTQNKPDT